MSKTSTAIWCHVYLRVANWAQQLRRRLQTRPRWTAAYHVGTRRQHLFLFLEFSRFVLCLQVAFCCKICFLFAFHSPLLTQMTHNACMSLVMQTFMRKLTSKIRTQLGWTDTGSHPTRFAWLVFTYLYFHVTQCFDAVSLTRSKESESSHQVICGQYPIFRLVPW